MTAGAAATLSAVFGLIYLYWLPRPASAMRSVVKTLPVAVLAVAAYALGAPLLAIALALSAMGDLFLARDGDRAFMSGLVAFLLAHLVYIALMGSPVAGMQAMPLAALFVGLVAASTEVWLRPNVGALVWPVRLYVLVIAFMAIAAFATSHPFVIVGALLFVISDLCLALLRFVIRDSKRTAQALGYAVWGLYIASQILLFLGLLG